MRKIILLTIFLLMPGCAYKQVKKNCVQSGDTEYYVCDNLGITGN